MPVEAGWTLNVAALDNDIGVIGVAAGASVVAVRVLDRRGSGSYSNVIAGVDYAGTNGERGDVANMSLGGSFSQALNDAVFETSKNVKFALAAGNESDPWASSSWAIFWATEPCPAIRMGLRTRWRIGSGG